MSCPSSKTKVASNAAPADGSNGKTLTQAKFEEQCCVETPKTCSDFKVDWVLAQGLAQGCMQNTKFFDLKTLSVEVASPAGEAEVKAACCTPFADAKCSDWNSMSCSGSGKTKVDSNAAPADGSNGMTLTQAKFDEKCCVETPRTCSDFSVAWAISQGLGLGCAPDTKFFDLKKLSVDVASPFGDAEVKTACCTPFADAKCSDWNSMSCPSSKTKVASNAAPADGSNGKTLTQAKFEEQCCVETPKTCSDFKVDWVLAQGLAQGCMQNTKFFDLKTLSVEVASPAGEAEVKAACCTPFADAKCSDWNSMSCPSSKFLSSTASAPADGSNGMTLTQAKFEEKCCKEAMKCADFTDDAETDSATSFSFSALTVLLLSKQAVSL